YFLQYSKKARDSVKTVVIVIYSPNIYLIKDEFPNVRIIIDKFHIHQLFSRALNKTGIKVMNREKKNNNKLKKYWRLILKDDSKVDYIHFRYHRSFKKQMRKKDIIHYLIDLDPELKASYELYQYVLLCLRTKNFKLLKKVLSTKQKHVSDYMKTAIHTTKKYLSYVENTFKYKYNNGVLEGINNKIKTIKRIAFGYRCFYHFKNRILITHNLVTIKRGVH